MSHRQVPDSDVDGDARPFFGTLLRRLLYLIVFVGVVAAATFLLLGRIEPVYKSHAAVLIVPDLARAATGAGDAAVIDREAIGSQVQLVGSRDLAKTVAAKLNLAAYPEFDPRVGPSWLDGILAVAGLASPRAEGSIEERVLDAYYDRLSVYAVDNSRVIGVDFSSGNAELSAAAANAIVEEYIALLRAAMRGSGDAGAAQRLSAEVDGLRVAVQEAEAKVERHRSDHDLLASAGATPSQQQLSDLGAELAQASAARAAAEAKAAGIRSILASGGVSGFSGVSDSQLLQRLVEQHATLRAEIAKLDATLLPLHPRMRELAAQRAEIERQIAGEAARVLESFEGEARLAAVREDELGRSLVAMKAALADSANAGVTLRALQREAAAKRDLLASTFGRYREALARGAPDTLPADARIVSRAAVPAEPDFPKIVPMTAAAAVAALLLAVAFVLLRTLAGGRPARPLTYRPRPSPAAPGARQSDGPARWADDHGVRRMMIREPTLVPEMVDRVEEALTTIAGDIVRSGKKRVLVTLAEGSEENGRPLGAVALARALARMDARVVLVDFRVDGANAASMGEAEDVPGFSDLFGGKASFAQVIFRDRKSRVHFIPAGRKPLSPDFIDRERMETVLSALTLTYDYVLLDAGDDMIGVVGPSCGAAMVVSEHGAADLRTVQAFERVREASDAMILLLVVDPSSAAPTQRDAGREASSAGAAA